MTLGVFLVARGVHIFQIRRTDVNIFSSHLQTADEGWFSSIM